MTRSAGTVESAEPPQANGSVGRSSDPPRDRSATPEVDPEEAAIEDSSSRVNDSAERLRQPEDRTLMATSRLLSAVPTSTGVDTEALPTTDLEQAAWDASVMLVSTGTDTDGNAMAVVSVPGHEADGPTSTGEGAAGWTGTRTRDSDGGASSEQENSGSRLISVEESFDIVGGHPRTGTAESLRAIGSSERASEPIDGTVAAASGVQVANSQGRIRPTVVWGQGIPLRPPMTVRRPAETIPSQATQADLNTSSAILSVSDAIDPASCLATTREPSVRAEADEAGINRRAEATKTVILVTASKNRLRLERQSVVLRRALTADTLTLFRDYECKMNHLIHFDGLLSYNDILANKYKLT